MSTRAAALDVAYDRPLALGCVVHARAVDVDGTGEVVRRVELTARVDDDGNLGWLTGADAAPAEVLADLDGAPVGRGWRARLAPLLTLGPQARLLRRVLWELPLSARIAGQTSLLDHPSTAQFVQLDLRGTDQCSGWRAGGEMLVRAQNDNGVLRMPLGPERPQHSIAETWLPELPDLGPLATRRSRVLTVDGDSIHLAHRDSYADPDGVTRGLHEWTVDGRTTGTADALRFGAFEVTAGQLPWVECPFAGGSVTRLVGRGPQDVDQVIGEQFVGTSTCTHLNDLLRMLADVPDLATSA